MPTKDRMTHPQEDEHYKDNQADLGGKKGGGGSAERPGVSKKELITKK